MHASGRHYWILCLMALVDQLFNGSDRSFANLCPRPHPIPFWLTSVVCVLDILQEPNTRPRNTTPNSSAFIDRTVPRDRLIHQCNRTAHRGKQFILSQVFDTMPLMSHKGRRWFGNVCCSGKGQPITPNSRKCSGNPGNDGNNQWREGICCKTGVEEGLMRSGLFIESFLFRTESVKCHPHLLYPANFAVFPSFYSIIMYSSFFFQSNQMHSLENSACYTLKFKCCYHHSSSGEQ
jgi:hypothetical protein